MASLSFLRVVRPGTTSGSARPSGASPSPRTSSSMSAKAALAAAIAQCSDGMAAEGSWLQQRRRRAMPLGGSKRLHGDTGCGVSKHICRATRRLYAGARRVGPTKDIDLLQPHVPMQAGCERPRKNERSSLRNEPLDEGVVLTALAFGLGALHSILGRASLARGPHGAPNLSALMSHRLTLDDPIRSQTKTDDQRPAPTKGPMMAAGNSMFGFPTVDCTSSANVRQSTYIERCDRMSLIARNLTSSGPLCAARFGEFQTRPPGGPRRPLGGVCSRVVGVCSRTDGVKRGFVEIGPWLASLLDGPPLETYPSLASWPLL